MEYKLIEHSKGIHTVSKPTLATDNQISYSDEIILELNEKIIALKAELIKANNNTLVPCPAYTEPNDRCSVHASWECGTKACLIQRPVV